MLVLLFLGILILFLCFLPKHIEGYYSDVNTSTANESLKKLIVAINETKESFNKIKENREKLTCSEVIAKLQPILKKNKDSLYSSGIIDKVGVIVDELSTLQRDFDQVNDALKMLNDTYIPIMDIYIQKIENIKELVTHIPDEERTKDSAASVTKRPK